MSRSLTILITFFSFFTSYGQNSEVDIIIDIPNISIEKNEIVCLPVTVTKGFDALILFQLGIYYDPKLLNFTSLTAKKLPPKELFANTNESTGETSLIWTAEDLANGTNIPNGEVLFEICFMAKAKTGDCSGVVIGNLPSGSHFEIGRVDATGNVEKVKHEKIQFNAGSVCFATSCQERDSHGLMAIFNATDGTNWTHNDNWGTDTPLRGWYGVRTNSAGCVICLDLDGDDNCTPEASNGNGLVGQLPSKTGNLIDLESLSLSNNKLSGNMPKELGNLNKLNSLYLQNNQFSGCYPEEIINKYCKLGFIPNPNIQNAWKGYDFTNNPALPFKGNFLKICNGLNQTGARCDDGNAKTGNDVIQKDCSCKGDIIMGLNNLSENKIVILPNPFDAYIEIQSKISISEVEIFNYAGQLLLSIQDENIQKISTNKLSIGIYILKLRDEEGVVSFTKIIK